MLSFVHHLVGAAEVARMLGVTRARVNQLAEQDDFPDPEAVGSYGRIWATDAIRAWARATGRELAQEDE